MALMIKLTTRFMENIMGHTMYEETDTILLRGIILWVHTIFQPTVHKIGGLCCRSQDFNWMENNMCFERLPTNWDPIHTRPTWMGSNLKIRTIQICREIDQSIFNESSPQNCLCSMLFCLQIIFP